MKLARFSSITLLAIVAADIIHHTARAYDPETGFRTPQHSAGIHGFWWRLNGNVNAEAITRERPLDKKGNVITRTVAQAIPERCVLPILISFRRRYGPD